MLEAGAEAATERDSKADKAAVLSAVAAHFIGLVCGR